MGAVDIGVVRCLDEIGPITRCARLRWASKYVGGNAFVVHVISSSIFLGGWLVAVLGGWAVLALAKPPLVFVAGFIECSLPMAWWSARVRAGCRVLARGKVGYLAGWSTCAQLAWFPSRLPEWVKEPRFPFHEDGTLQRAVASRRNRNAVSISQAQHGVGELLVCHTELWGESRATSCIDASEF